MTSRTAEIIREIPALIVDLRSVTEPQAGTLPGAGKMGGTGQDLRFLLLSRIHLHMQSPVPRRYAEPELEIYDHLGTWRATITVAAKVGSSG